MLVLFAGVIALVTSVAREASAIRRSKTETASRVTDALRGTESGNTVGRPAEYVKTEQDERIAKAV